MMTMLSRIKDYSLFILGGISFVLYALLKISNNDRKQKQEQINRMEAEQKIKQKQDEFKKQVLASEAKNIIKEIDNAKDKTLLDRINRH